MLHGVLTNATLYFIQLPIFFYLRLTFALVLITFFLVFHAEKVNNTRFVLANNVGAYKFHLFMEAWQNKPLQRTRHTRLAHSVF
jgi:hypothetical protein